MNDRPPEPEGSDYIRAVAYALAAEGVSVDFDQLDLDEEAGAIPVRTDDGLEWVHWRLDEGWFMLDPGGWRCAPICGPTTPAEHAARRLARYV